MGGTIRDPREPFQAQPPGQNTLTMFGPYMGCICPPGANLQCENPMCPRKDPMKQVQIGAR
jgi:hypothetical protein